MKYLKNTDDYSSLVTVKYKRVIYENPNKKVFFDKGYNSLYWKIDGTTLYIRATPQDGYEERILYADLDLSKNGWYTASTKANVTKVVFEEVIHPTSCDRFFDGMMALQTFDNFDNLKMRNCTTARAMFQNCRSLTSLDLNGWDVRNVKWMNHMFNHCFKLTTLDVDTWNVRKVTTLRSMFQYCSGLTSVNVSEWNTTHVTDMSYLFNYCHALTSVGDLSGWNTSKVTTVKQMFNCCSGVTSVGDLSEWNTSNVTDMSFMFQCCYVLPSIGDLSSWDTSNVTDMSYLISYCYALTSVGDLSEWNTSKVTSMRTMFQYTSIKSLGDLRNWDTSNVTDMSWMFNGSKELLSLDGVEAWDTSKVTNMGVMFSNCNALLSVGDLSNWDVSKVTDMYSMFSECRVLTSVGDLSNWDVSKVTNMSYMFDGCYQLNGSNCQFIGQWNPSSCTNFQSMNRIGQSCAVVDNTWSLPNWVLNSSCTSLVEFYRYGPNFKVIDISNIDFSKITTISRMFMGNRCSEIKFGKNISNTVILTDIFNATNNLTDIYFDTTTSTTAWQRIADEKSTVTVHIGDDKYQKVDDVWTLITT